jgi:hypothetical protein
MMLFELIMTENKIHFYSYYGCDKSPNFEDCMTFDHVNEDISFPCIVLMRFNNWNDYNYHTHFQAFYLPNKGKINKLGTVVIIQSKAENKYTKLPDKFHELSKKKYFSRGFFDFYKQLDLFGKIKDEVLGALNDIYFFHYTREDICKIDFTLSTPYDDSLFRNNYIDFDISSEYARDSNDMFDRISSLVWSLDKIEGENDRKVMSRLLFGSIITSLEAYLGDAFKFFIFKHKKHFNSFLKNHKFPEKKISWEKLGSEDIDSYIRKKVQDTINNISFHNLKKVNKLYKDILNVDLPKNWSNFNDSIRKRHDIFHRNGKTIAGTTLEIEPSEISSLIRDAKNFISEMERILLTQIKSL